MNNIITLYPVNVLTVGQVIRPTTSDSSHTILAASLKNPKGNGNYAVWVILHLIPNSLHPFAVHYAVDRPDGWALENGYYHANLTEALATYAKKSAGQIG